MNSLIEHLNLGGDRALRVAWQILCQSSLLILILFALEFALRRKVRGAVRHALWRVVLVKLLLPPSLALPTGVAWWLRSSPVIQAERPLSTFVARGAVMVSNPSPLPAAVNGPPAAPKRVSPRFGLAVVWLALSCALLVWMLLRWRQVSGVARRAAAPPGWLLEILVSAKKQLVIGRRVELGLTDQAMSPAVCGLFRPVILLPTALIRRLKPEQLRAVLLHELFHLKRGDVWVNCAQALVQIVYWWHPLLWLANARIRRIREEAVDDAVMATLREQADTYAPTLLEVARLALHRPLASLGLVGILESKHALRQRIERLLNSRTPGKTGLGLGATLGILAFTALAVPMGEAPLKLKPVPSEAKATLNTWPDPRFTGYQEVELEAKFLLVDQARLHEVLPFLADSSAPLTFRSNDLADLNIRLEHAGARAYATDGDLRFPKFSGGQFRWQLGTASDNAVDWQTRSDTDRTVIGAKVALIPIQPDWAPFEFKLVPWDENGSVRCEMELGTNWSTNEKGPVEVTLSAEGAVLWAFTASSLPGKYQLIMLRHQPPKIDPDAWGEIARQPDAKSWGLWTDGVYRDPWGIPYMLTNDAASPAQNPSNATSLKPKPEVARLVQEARLLLQTGDVDGAEAKVKEALKMDRQNEAARFYLNAIREVRFQKALKDRDSLSGKHEEVSTQTTAEASPQPTRILQSAVLKAPSVQNPQSQPMATNLGTWQIESLNPAGAIHRDAATGVTVASNGALVRYGSLILSAERVTVNQKTGEVVADGGVRVEQNGRTWHSEHVRYNFTAPEGNPVATDDKTTEARPHEGPKIHLQTTFVELPAADAEAFYQKFPPAIKAMSF